MFTAQSGRPFTPRVSFDNSNTGNVGGGTFAYDRPNVVASGTPPAGARFSYGGQTFVIAPQSTFGNAGREQPRRSRATRRSTRWSAGRLAIGDRRRQLTLRLEIFNALNRKNLQLPDSFVDRVTFGRSLAAFPPRQIQLAARFTF